MRRPGRFVAPIGLFALVLTLGAWAGPRPLTDPAALAALLRRDTVLHPLAGHARCVSGVVRHFDLYPTQLYLAVLRTEGGRPGQARRNGNGTWDYGPAQINSSWIPRLRRRGLPASATTLRHNTCFNLYVSGWILRRELDAAPDLWTGLLRYHSRTPVYQHRYLQRILDNWAALSRLRRR